MTQTENQEVLEIQNAELVITFATGEQIAVEVSPVQLELFMRGTGMEISPSEGGYMVNQYSDKDVKDHVLPLLPE